MLGLLATPVYGESTDSVHIKQRPSTALTIGTDFVITGAVTVGVTEILKHSVHEWRPNLHDDRAFPSRHASWAFAASTFLANNFYATQPWVPPVAQASASAVALQRLHCGAHFGGDVAAGMAIGSAGAVIGHVVSGWIFGRPMRIAGDVASFRTSIGVYSVVLMPGHRSRGWRSGFSSGVLARLPLSSKFGLAASAGAFAVSRIDPAHTRYVPAVEGLTLTVGGAAVIPLPARSLAFTADVTAGPAYIRRWSSRWAFTADIRAGIQWHLTRHFAASIHAGYNYLSTPALNTLTISTSSAYLF